jgi:hypothetical protein
MLPSAVTATTSERTSRAVQPGVFHLSMGGRELWQLLPGLPLHMRYALEITSVHRIRPTPEGRTRAYALAFSAVDTLRRTAASRSRTFGRSRGRPSRADP